MPVLIAGRDQRAESLGEHVRGDTKVDEPRARRSPPRLMPARAKSRRSMIAAARSRGFRPKRFASTIARFVAQSPNAGSRGRSMTGSTSSGAPRECAARVELRAEEIGAVHQVSDFLSALDERRTAAGLVRSPSTRRLAPLRFRVARASTSLDFRLARLRLAGFDSSPWTRSACRRSSTRRPPLAILRRVAVSGAVPRCAFLP